MDGLGWKGYFFLLGSPQAFPGMPRPCQLVGHVSRLCVHHVARTDSRALDQPVLFEGMTIQHCSHTWKPEEPETWKPQEPETVLDVAAVPDTSYQASQLPENPFVWDCDRLSTHGMRAWVRSNSQRGEVKTCGAVLRSFEEKSATSDDEVDILLLG